MTRARSIFLTFAILTAGASAATLINGQPASAGGACDAACEADLKIFQEETEHEEGWLYDEYLLDDDEYLGGELTLDDTLDFFQEELEDDWLYDE